MFHFKNNNIFTENDNRVIYLGIAVLCLISNIVAFFFQLFYYELPCPLCLLQRFGLLAIGFGAMLNLLKKPLWRYDLVIIISCIFTLIVALRQVLLHIEPNDPGYGKAFLGLHFYTWSALLSFGLIVLMASIPIAQEIIKRISFLNRYPNIIDNLMLYGFLMLSLMNIISTYLECGFTICPADPVSYLKLTS